MVTAVLNGIVAIDVRVLERAHGSIKQLPHMVW